MPRLMPRPKQIAIAFDQFCNTLLGGWADETFSARCWRLRFAGKGWGVACKLVDGILWFDKDHCRESYESERQGKQLPKELREK